MTYLKAITSFVSSKLILSGMHIVLSRTNQRYHVDSPEKLHREHTGGRLLRKRLDVREIFPLISAEYIAINL